MNEVSLAVKATEEMVRRSQQYKKESKNELKLKTNKLLMMETQL
jgi:hypothetical protein